MIARSLMLCILALSLSATGNAAAGELSPVTATTPLVLHLPDLEGQVQALESLRGGSFMINFPGPAGAHPASPKCRAFSICRRHGRPAFHGRRRQVGEGSPGQGHGGELGLDFPILLDKDSAAFERLRISVLPTTYLLDGDGIVRYVGRGQLEWDSAEVKDILQEIGAAR